MRSESNYRSVPVGLVKLHQGVQMEEGSTVHTLLYANQYESIYNKASLAKPYNKQHYDLSADVLLFFWFTPATDCSFWHLIY